MSITNKPSVTPRAYTLRLRRAPGECVLCRKNDCNCWRENLWQTHEAVNKGAKAFGDWLLTLRGGLEHTLADNKVKGGKGKPDRDPTDDERKARRILLALSWLSVESKIGAPPEFIVASGQDVAKNRNGKVFRALEEILKTRRMAKKNIEEWKNDCSASLSAAIRKDAVWVNRSKAFDRAVKSIGASLTREEAWDMLERFFGSRVAYLTPIQSFENESSDAAEQEEKGKDLIQKAGQWLSSRFGAGKGADFRRMANVYNMIARWADKAHADMDGNQAINSLASALSIFTPASNNLKGVLDLISGPGYKSATRNLLSQFSDKTSVSRQDLFNLRDKAKNDARKCNQRSGSKGQRPYSEAILKNVESVCGFTYLQEKGPARHSEFAVMLDHAARRVSLAHTWIKRAEAERSKFEEDAKKANQVSKAAKNWLDLFCIERSVMSSALEQYRIRRRAVDGWKEVVAAWGKRSCNNLNDRIAEARALQEMDKFGDIQLFEALAEDDAVCVWHEDGDATKAPAHQQLIDYVLATEAEFKKRHFKVPAYCHSDSLVHPVFCDFGNSRWDIDFSIREAASCLEKAQTACTNKQAVVDKIEKIIKKPSGKVEKKSRLIEKLKKAKSEYEEARRELVRLNSKRGMTMTLFNGSDVKKTALGWQSKRLAADLALHTDDDSTNNIRVSRANRLGRAASNVIGSDGVKISGLFEQADWNGRLQAPRKQLEDIGKRVAKYGWDIKAQKMRDNLQWLVSFSAKLQPNGPWCDFASANDLKLDQKNGEIIIASQNSKNDWRGLAYPFWHSSNEKGRKGMAKHNLSRLSGLRVLSVDLGHRYAAACAVWEAINTKELKKVCRAAQHDAPKASDLYLHLKQKVKKEKNGNLVEMNKITVYRRIGAETLSDGMQHPAPWARLDRQFLIKLQGEEEGIREASNEEVWKVNQLESELGRTAPVIDRLVKAGWGQSDRQKTRLNALHNLGWTPASGAEVSDRTDENECEVCKPSLSVDELMSSAVRTMRLALKRHGDRARIAFAMSAECKPMPGDRRYFFTEAKELSVNDDQATRGNKHIEFIQDALMLWHGLASLRGWRDDVAKQLWDNYIANLSGYKAIKEISEDVSDAERKKKQKENREKLHDVAEALVKDARLRRVLHNVWKKRWEQDDKWWKERLRWLKDWILPRGQAANGPAIRKVGGLSLTRLATLTEFRRKVQVGFYMRLKPDGTSVEIKERFGQRTLDALENLREQRVKQLASRLTEAALGIGRMKRFRGEKDAKRPRERVDKPCHAIVIEDLTHYRPEETRTRRENRQIMTWSSSRVKKYLSEACQLHGLHLREVPAGYTSRQDSRTGAPGIRCQDISVKEFMRSYFWRKQVKNAQEKLAEDKGNSRERYLCKLAAMWTDKAAVGWEKGGNVRVPLKGGEIFVSADRRSPAAKGIQADLNAAANIGLRALTDPDWPGKWWYVPCDPASFKPVRDKVGGCAAVNPDTTLWQSAQVQSCDTDNNKKKQGKKDARNANGVVNLWRDISSSPLECIGSGEWKEYAAYQNDVQCRVIRILEEQIKERGWHLHDGSKEDEIPF